MNPVIGRRLTETEQLAHHDLQRIGFEIDQDEQQLLFRRLQLAAASAADLPLALLSGQRLVAGIPAAICLSERWQQRLELFER
jgi:hypothetical protein